MLLRPYFSAPQLLWLWGVAVATNSSADLLKREYFKLSTNVYHESQALSLRAHHICCIQFWVTDFTERGTVFLQTLDKIKCTLNSCLDSLVTVIEGVDDLCQQCPLCVNDRCTSPFGDEDKVRKLDSILLKEFGLSYNRCLRVKEWQALIEAKLPYQICRKCQWQHECQVRHKL